MCGDRSTRTGARRGCIRHERSGRLAARYGHPEAARLTYFGLFAQQTLGTRRTTYQETHCLFGCITTEHTALDGGLSVGLSVAVSGSFRLGPSGEVQAKHLIPDSWRVR